VYYKKQLALRNKLTGNHQYAQGKMGFSNEQEKLKISKEKINDT